MEIYLENTKSGSKQSKARGQGASAVPLETRIFQLMVRNPAMSLSPEVAPNKKSAVLDDNSALCFLLELNLSIVTTLERCWISTIFRVQRTRQRGEKWNTGVTFWIKNGLQ